MPETFIIETNHLVGETGFMPNGASETFWEWCKKESQEKDNVVQEILLCKTPALIIIDNLNKGNLSLKCLEVEVGVWDKIKCLDNVSENVVKIYRKSALCGIVPRWFGEKKKLYEKLDNAGNLKGMEVIDKVPHLTVIYFYEKELATFGESNVSEYNQIKRYKALALEACDITLGISVNPNVQSIAAILPPIVEVDESSTEKATELEGNSEPVEQKKTLDLTDVNVKNKIYEWISDSKSTLTTEEQIFCDMLIDCIKNHKGRRWKEIAIKKKYAQHKKPGEKNKNFADRIMYCCKKLVRRIMQNS